MKKTLLLLGATGFLILGGLSVFAQQITYKELSTGAMPAMDEYLSYVSKDGSRYMVGAKIKIGIPRGVGVFTFITNGDGVLLPITQMASSFANSEMEIRKIKISGTKKTGFRAFFFVKSGVNYRIDFENAVEVGEVRPYGYTSDEALVELKKAKDKLDLGLISQAKYDSIKAVLSKFIN